MNQTRIACQGERFSLPADVHYLNCAYMGPLPRVAEEAGQAALAMKRVPTGIEPRHFFEESDRLRDRFARIMGGTDPARVALHPAVSYGVATAARNLPLSQGARILVVEEQFPGNVYAWRRLASEAGGSLQTVARPDGAHAGRAWNERILEAITPVTEIVAVPTVHWTDGTRFDLESIGARAREVGAALVVDATQSCGAVPFDAAAVEPDAFIAAGYKWMLGPYSVAFTYLGERFDHGTPLEETWIGRRGSEDFQGLVEYTDDYQPGAVRYDVGERSNFFLLPIASAALKLILEWTPAGIAEYVQTLSRPVIETARQLGFGVEEEAFRSPHLFGLKMPRGVELAEVRQALADARIYVSLRGSSLRVSPHVYNTEEDVAALERVLRQVVGA